MLLYLLSKNEQNAVALWHKTKSEYESKNPSLKESLEAYVSSSGKKNLEERMLVAALIMESLGHMKCFDHECREPLALEKSDMGKPYFKGTNLRLSIAHNEDFVAVAYAKFGEIGIDIEREIDEEKVQNLSKRFPQITSLKIEQSADNSNEKIQAFEMKNDGTFSPINITTADNSFTAKWTAAEALMKCDGRGFSALSDIQKLQEKIDSISLIYLKDNKKYCISITNE
jgi:phosphopantetheinyl transferase